MGELKRNIQDFFKSGRKTSERASPAIQPNETNRRNSSDDVQGAGAVLLPSRAESWPWHFTISDRPSSSESSGTPPNLDAARSEAWPWSVTAATTGKQGAPEAEGGAEENVNSYFDVLHAASQQGYQAPPRHEVDKYQHKPLPPLPSVRETHVTSSRPSPAVPASRQATMPSTRLSMAVERSTVEDAHIYQRETVSEQLKWETRNHIISMPQSTWVSRLERRAQNDKRGRGLLEK